MLIWLEFVFVQFIVFYYLTIGPNIAELPLISDDSEDEDYCESGMEDSYGDDYYDDIDSVHSDDSGMFLSTMICLISQTKYDLR